MSPGSSTAADSSGGTTTDSPSSTSTAPETSSGSTSTGDPDTSSTGDDSSGDSSAGGEPGQWLLTIDNGTSPPTLIRVGLAGGVSELCGLPAAVDYRSIVFGRDGTLYGYNNTASRLDVINPCDCSFQIVGPTSVGPLRLSLGDPAGDELLAIAPTLDALASVNVETGLTTTIGGFTFPFEGVGLAWAEPLGGLFAIEGSNDYLYAIDPTTAQDTDLVPLSADVGNPGFVQHPGDGLMYACDADTLYTVDAVTGVFTPIGPLGLSSACEMLAAPQTAVACVDDA